MNLPPFEHLFPHKRKHISKTSRTSVVKYKTMCEKIHASTYNRGSSEFLIFQVKTGFQAVIPEEAAGSSDAAYLSVCGNDDLSQVVVHGGHGLAHTV